MLSLQSQKGGQPDVYSDCSCFYMGNKTDLSVDGNSVADRAVSNRNHSVGISLSFILNIFSNSLLTSTCSCTKI